MLQTLFRIPETIAGLPLFGFGVIFVLWLIGSGIALAYLVRKQGWSPEVRSYLPVLGVLGLVIVFVLPVLVEGGGLPIRGYGVMLLLAVVAGVGLSIHRAKQMGLNPDVIYSLAFWMFIGGMLGARLFYIIEYWEQFQKSSLGESLSAMANVAQGGLVVYGGLIGGLAAFVAFVRRHELPALALADLISPGMALGLCLGRIGCLLNGCCFGGICEPPSFGSAWAVTFPWESPPHQRQAKRGELDFHGMSLAGDGTGPAKIAAVVEGSPADIAGLKQGDVITSIKSNADDKLGGPVLTLAEARNTLYTTSTPGAALRLRVAGSPQPIELTLADPLPRSRPVHATQIYSSINALLICLVILTFYPYRTRDGQVVALLLTIYPMTRFLLEIIRKDEMPVFGSGMSISQNVSLILFAGVVCLWIYVLRSKEPLALPPPQA